MEIYKVMSDMGGVNRGRLNVISSGMRTGGHRVTLVGGKLNANRRWLFLWNQ